MILAVYLLILFFKKLKLISAKFINGTDFVLLWLLFICVFNSLGYISCFKTALFIYSSKFCLVVYIIVFLAIVSALIHRIFIASHKETIIKKHYTLFNLYNGNIKDNDFILVDEPVCEDIFGRGHIVDEIKYYIDQFNFEGKYVLALTGEWGSGKTTILNILKNVVDKEKIYLIDDFDSWQYNDEISLFEGVLKAIANKLNIYSANSISAIKKLVSKYVNNQGLNISLEFMSFDLSGERLIKLINDRLKSENKKIVFIFDNIDRATDDNVLLIYKIISSILKINRILYVLSYDKNIVNKIFERKNIDVHFPEKIIQKEIILPMVGISVLEGVFSKCLNELYRILYSPDMFSSFDFKKVDSTFKLVGVEIFSSIREMILFLNDILFSIKKAYNVNQFDVLTITLIKNCNYALYEEIRNNPLMFVSIDKEYYHFRNYDEFKIEKNDRKTYMKNLFAKEENKKFEKVLRKMFPIIDEVEDRKSITPEEEKKLRNDRSICSAKFFSTYFLNNFDINVHYKLSVEIENIINKIKTGENGLDLLKKFFQKYEKEEQEEVYLIFRNYLEKVFDDININIQLQICEYLVINCNNFDTKGENYTAYFRNVLLTTKLIGKLSKSNFKSISGCFGDFSKLGFNREVVHYSKKFISEGQKMNENYLEIEKINNALINNIIKNKIDIYSEDNYGRYNIFALENRRGVKTLLKVILNENNVLKFLINFISSYYSETYNYYLETGLLKKYVSVAHINKLISRIDKSMLSDNELFVLNVFKGTDFNCTESFYKRKDVYVSNKRIYF